MRATNWFTVLVLACNTDPPKEDEVDPGDIPTDHGTGTTPQSTTPIEACDLPAPAPYAVPVEPSCESAPEIGSFDPVTEWSWTDNALHPGYHQVVVTPVVIGLTDDDGDGDIDPDDTPDVVFMAFEGLHYADGGALTAISGSDGTLLWSILEAGGAHPRGTGGVAAGDLDGDGRPEIVVPALEGLLCVGADGSFEWLSPVDTDASAMPAIGDLEGDGFAEVVVGKNVVEHDGALRWTGTAGQGGTLHVASFPVDLDGDGLQEVVAGNTVYEHDGQIRWTDDLTDGKPAVADFDGDGVPEIVRVFSGTVHLAGVDGTARWTFSLADTGGGAPTVADLDGDGAPEVGVASASAYTVVDTDGTLLWSNTTDDSSSALTGSSVFDFEGDGTLEIVYADEHTLWVFDGATGAVELQWDSHGSGTLHEYPVVADVDGDGAAEIVVPSNDYAWDGSRGITVIGDRTGSWAPARPVWNQHAYAITNVDDDGGIPPFPSQSWTESNSFRAANSVTVPPVAEPDLAVGEPELCLTECAQDRVQAWFPVENGGAADGGPVTVTVTRLDLLGPSTVAVVELPAVALGSAVWVGPFTLSSADFGSDGLSVEAVPTVGADCDESDDLWLITDFPCP